MRLVNEISGGKFVDWGARFIVCLLILGVFPLLTVFPQNSKIWSGSFLLSSSGQQFFIGQNNFHV